MFSIAIERDLTHDGTGLVRCDISRAFVKSEVRGIDMGKLKISSLATIMLLAASFLVVGTALTLGVSGAPPQNVNSSEQKNESTPNSEKSKGKNPAKDSANNNKEGTSNGDSAAPQPSASPSPR